MEGKPRKWWLSGLLSFFRPGLGQIYNGQGLKGIILFIVGTLFVPFLTLKILSGYPSRSPLQAMIFIFCISAGFGLFAISDAIFYSIKKRNHYQLKKYNKWVVYAAVFLCGILLPILVPFFKIAPDNIKENYLQAYKIPSQSMVPTLLPGDFILVDRRLSAREPARGEIIVFQYPGDEKKDFVKRVVAVGGDTVQVRDKELYVNNRLVEDTTVIHQEPDVIPAEFSSRDNFGPATVPEGSFFVMGDNRDRAFDSRFFGFVDGNKIRGTARQIYWSWNPKTLAIHWERIGTGLF